MLKYPLRYLRKNLRYTLINILGLSISFSAALLLIAYALFHLSFDDFHQNGENIYRVNMHLVFASGGEESYASTYSPVGKRLQEEFPEVIDFATFYKKASLISKLNSTTSFNEERVCFATNSFFKMFTIPIIEGDKTGKLNDPSNIYISESASRKYFGDENPIGEVLIRNHNEEYIVRGVFEDAPVNTHFNFDFIISFNAYATIEEDNVYENWAWWDTYYSYVQLDPNASLSGLEAKFPEFVKKHRGDTWAERGYRTDLSLQRLDEIHFGLAEKSLGDDVNTIKKSDISTFIIIASFILLISWINFINLSTSQSLTRGKEVGIRKILGSNKKQIVVQFLTETLLVNSLAILLAALIFATVIPLFLNELGLGITLADLLSIKLVGVYIGVLLIGSLLAGYYPSLLLLALKPVSIIKGKFQSSLTGNRLRTVLIITQFTCAIVLLTVTVGMYEQISHMKSQQLGFDSAHKLTFKAPVQRDSLYDNQVESLLNQLVAESEIINYTSSSTVPGMPQEFQIGGVRRVGAETDNSAHFGLAYIDDRFVDVFDLEFLAGENLHEIGGSDRDKVLINEVALHILGYSNPEEALGTEIIIPRGTVTVKGVIKDYHNQSLKSDYKPTVYRFRGEGFKSHHTLLYDANADIQTVIAKTQKQWNQHFEKDPFEYFLLADNYEDQYKEDTNFAKVILVFSALAILVACLGLYSIALINVQFQKRQIAIRKVLGAKFSSLLGLLYKKYIVIILISFGLALPPALVFINTWKRNFAFKANWSFDLVSSPLLLITAITGITIASILIRTVRQNPVEVIRND
ncbi:MAG: ABC transporter permease [Fulvivirga sp.]|uniref:ABC transporter permease n=1 Tax=Fulvivirga sp. TaxID=1931237 RepID=UPI0032EB30C5